MIQPADFSNYLFWDVDRDTLDLDKYKAYVIERVLSYGMLTDWVLLKELYGKEVIHATVINLRNLDKYSLHFCAAYFNEPLENFRCYTLMQSIPVHWDY